MRKTRFYVSTIAATALLLTSCSSDDSPAETPVRPGGDNPDPTTEIVTKYLVTATPTASEGVADYILTVDDLDQGVISTEGNGIEQDGTYRYYVQNNGKFFSLLYGQGNPGAVTTYELNADGALEKLSDFQSETVQAFAPVDDDLLLMKISRNSDSPIASWYRLDTETSTFVGEGQINTQELADKENGEIAFFSWITQVGDKVFLPYFTVKACCDDRFGTEYPNEANIAVYSYPDMTLEKVITDDRTSFIGRYFIKGLSVDENGDTYAFSSGIAKNNNELTSTLPSAITRIKSGTTEFDDSYYFNLEEASNGYYVTTQMYLGNGKFLANMAEVAKKAEPNSEFATGPKYAIIDVYTESITWVTGMPDEANIVQLTARNNFVAEDGKTASVGITTDSGSYIYNIDVASAAATQGLEVQGGTITAIDKIESTVEVDN